MIARMRISRDVAGAVFSALSDPTRRRIVRELAAQGPLTPTSLGMRAGVTRQAATKHLATLEEAGLARGRRTGREVRFELDTAPFAEAESWIRSIDASWGRRRIVLERLELAATESGEEE